jgi:hypothetical protein
VHIVIPPVARLRTLGDLVTFDKVTFKYRRAASPLLQDVSFSVPQDGRVAFVGAVGIVCHSRACIRLNAGAERSRQIYHRESHSPTAQTNHGKCSTPPTSPNWTLFSTFCGRDHQDGAREKDYSTAILHNVFWRSWRQGRRKRGNGMFGLSWFARENCLCHACRGTFRRAKGNVQIKPPLGRKANVAHSRSASPSV